MMQIVRKMSHLAIFKYAVVGGLTNLTGYVIYLLITWRWLDPKIAISLMYPIATTLGFYTHGKFSFSYAGGKLASLLRYIVAHSVGYAVNIGLLYVFVDLSGYPHQLVQVFAIVGVAGILFFLFRYFVFPVKI